MKLTLNETNFEIDEDLRKALNAEPGDRLDIEYLSMGGVLTPSIFKSEGGNKLTKSNTVSFKGKKRNELANFGTNFLAESDNGLISLKGDNKPIYVEFRKAVEERKFEISQLTNNQFKLNKFLYEL